ncbi:MAG TPA: hypothetical protein VFB23_01260 [Candidatus Acidoferrales bacterium]|jgi:hypothetical protein|nr:hypothetical protein [Candidatus Acidoferrales bacterium]
MRKVALRIGLVLAAAALALPMMAKSDKASDTKAKSTTLNIYQPVKFGDAMVKPGTYKLVIENDKATIQDGKKVVASANGKWEERKEKADATGFESTNGQVNDVFIGGDTHVFVLNQS